MLSQMSEIVEWIIVKLSRILCKHEWENDLSIRQSVKDQAIYGTSLGLTSICDKCGRTIYSAKKHNELVCLFEPKEGE